LLEYFSRINILILIFILYIEYNFKKSLLVPLMSNAKILILGASTNPARYSYLAANALSGREYNVIPVGLKKGTVAGRPILDIRSRPKIDNVDTITLYMNPQNQSGYLDYILSLNPRRIIFNPGTENNDLIRLAEDRGIEVIIDCTLVMLRSGYF
jgi:predicted CoA-binding protein